MKQRAARGKRIKEAESIPQDISLRSKTRTDSNISPAGTFAANRDVQIDRKRVASSGIATTPVKPGNLKISGDSTTRKDVSDGFVHELLDRRWASADLVDHSFDNVVSISLAAKLTLCFLHHQILSVTNTSRNQEVKRKDWPAACLHAASLARLASKAGKVTQEMKERYTWSWSKHLSTGTERGAQQFFNTVGFLAYIFEKMFDLDPKNLSQRTLRTRITTLPCSYSRLPLESPDSQDCRPDFFALHRSAFVTESKRDPTRQGDYMAKSSILLSISSYWPHLNKQYPLIFPSLSQGNVTGSGGQNNEEGLIDSLSFTPEGHDELLDDVTNGKYNAKEDDEDMNISSEAEDSSDDLLLQLKEILENLKTDSSHRVLSSSVSADVEDYGRATFLDLSSATVYIRQQRRTQPWLRFCLGFMATKDKMGLLRADATGVEECIIPKNIGRGVIESIRLSLGILLATDQELEQHPSFYLRLVTKSTAEPTTVAADNTRPAVDDHNDRSPKKMRSQTSGSVPSMAIPSTPTKSPDPPRCLTFREVNWIILHEGKLHGQHLSNRAPTIFYVKHLIEDRGSLVGRCTRVWCVYQEVLNSDPILNRYRNVLPAGSCVMKGPYALKAYNADMFSKAYEQDILVKSMDLHRLKPFDGVLLPTHVWHFGEVLTLMRGLTQDQCPLNIPSDKIKNRQEVFTVSVLKRTLSQFETVEEFYGAIIGVLQGIESLEAIKIIHRDISFGNIILNKEIYCDTDREFEWISVDGVDSKRCCVALLRRETVDIGTCGGLHDLNMAAYAPKMLINQMKWPHIRNAARSKPVSMVQQKTHRDLRTGTVPFMAIPLLLGGQNSVYDDLQSLFFVLYLSMFTFNQLPRCFPNVSPPLTHRWPRAFLEWTSSDQSMAALGLYKSYFFLSTDGHWYHTVKSDALPLWTTRDKMLKEIHWDMLLAFHQQLWTFDENDSSNMPFRNNNEVRPSSIRTVLQRTMEALDMDSEIPVGN